jgi:hypothetical protein
VAVDRAVVDRRRAAAALEVALREDDRPRNEHEAGEEGRHATRHEQDDRVDEDDLHRKQDGGGDLVACRRRPSLAVAEGSRRQQLQDDEQRGCSRRRHDLERPASEPHAPVGDTTQSSAPAPRAAGYVP